MFMLKMVCFLGSHHVRPGDASGRVDVKVIGNRMMRNKDVALEGERRKVRKIINRETGKGFNLFR